MVEGLGWTSIEKPEFLYAHAHICASPFTLQEWGLYALPQMSIWISQNFTLEAVAKGAHQEEARGNGGIMESTDAAAFAGRCHPVICPCQYLPVQLSI